MFVFRTYACAGGDLEEHTFELMQDRDEGPPKFCPKCGSEIGDVEAVPGTHSIGGSNIKQAVDGMYRWLEDSSAERAELAGNPKLKVTNLKDNLREGDVAAVPLPANPVTNFMGDARERGIQYGFQTGGAAGVAHGAPRAPLEPGVYTGPGHIALAGAQSAQGRSTARELVEAGRMNRPQAK